MRLAASLILFVLALVFCVVAAMGHMPLWPAVLCIAIEGIARAVPPGGQ